MNTDELLESITIKLDNSTEGMMGDGTIMQKMEHLEGDIEL